MIRHSFAAVLLTVTGCAGATPSASTEPDPPNPSANVPQPTEKECVVSWDRLRNDPEQVVEIEDGKLVLDVKPIASLVNSSGVTLSKPVGAGDFAIELAYRDLTSRFEDATEVRHDYPGILEIRLSKSAPKSKKEEQEGDASLSLWFGGERNMALARSVRKDGADDADAHDQVPPETSGVIRLTRRGGQLSIELASGGRTYPFAASVTPSEQFLTIAVTTSNKASASVRVERIAVGEPDQPASFVDDFACNTLAP